MCPHDCTRGQVSKHWTWLALQTAPGEVSFCWETDQQHLIKEWMFPQHVGQTNRGAEEVAPIPPLNTVEKWSDFVED